MQRDKFNKEGKMNKTNDTIIMEQIKDINIKLDDIAKNVNGISSYLFGNDASKQDGIYKKFEKLEKEHNKFFEKDNMDIWLTIKTWFYRLQAWKILVSLILSFLGITSVTSGIFIIYELWKLFHS